MGDTSPIPDQVEEIKPMTDLLDFPTALEVLKAGAKIHRTSWTEVGSYVAMVSGLMVLHKEDGKDYAWQISQADLEAEDWTTVR